MTTDLYQVILLPIILNLSKIIESGFPIYELLI